MTERGRKFRDYFSETRYRLSNFLVSVKPDRKQIKDLTGFFGTAFAVIVLLYAILLAAYFMGPRRAYGAEGTTSIEFDAGIFFRTRYQNSVKIRTPIIVQMDNETRALNFVLKDPSSAKFTFLFKITEGDYISWRDKVKDGHGNAMFTSSGAAYFVREHGDDNHVGQITIIVRIDQITLIIDRGPNQWLDDYKSLIEANFRNCQMGTSPKGQPDMICPPLWISAKINRIERSILSPSLPKDHVFPYLDYADIYIDIIGVSRTRPKN